MHAERSPSGLRPPRSFSLPLLEIVRDLPTLPGGSPPTHLGDATDDAFETFEPKADSTFPIFATAFPVLMNAWLSVGAATVVAESEFSPVSCITCR